MLWAHLYERAIYWGTVYFITKQNSRNFADYGCFILYFTLLVQQKPIIAAYSLDKDGTSIA